MDDHLARTGSGRQVRNPRVVCLGVTSGTWSRITRHLRAHQWLARAARQNAATQHRPPVPAAQHPTHGRASGAGIRGKCRASAPPFRSTEGPLRAGIRAGIRRDRQQQGGQNRDAHASAPVLPGGVRVVTHRPSWSLGHAPPHGVGNQSAFVCGVGFGSAPCVNRSPRAPGFGCRGSSTSRTTVAGCILSRHIDRSDDVIVVQYRHAPQWHWPRPSVASLVIGEVEVSRGRARMTLAQKNKMTLAPASVVDRP